MIIHVCLSLQINECSAAIWFDKSLYCLFSLACLGDTKTIGIYWCEDENNNKECTFDGGDCCLNGTVFTFCELCFCHETGNYATISPEGTQGYRLECPITQRQSTLDCRYLISLCDNLKKWMFLQNFFSWHYFGNVLCFSSYPNHSTILQPNNFIMDWNIRLLGQTIMF
jgi:hypothetical protein